MPFQRISFFFVNFLSIMKFKKWEQSCSYFCFSYFLDARFHTILSLCKGSKARWHFKSAFPTLLCQSILFLKTAPCICTLPQCAHTSYTHLLLAHWQWCPWLPPRLCVFGWLNCDLWVPKWHSAGCCLTQGPIRSQNQQQICHIHPCDELLDI